jgi:hypothetical protein
LTRECRFDRWKEIGSVWRNKDRKVVRVTVEIGVGNSGWEETRVMVAGVNVISKEVRRMKYLRHDMGVCTYHSKPSLERGLLGSTVIEIRVNSENPQNICHTEFQGGQEIQGNITSTPASRHI